MHMYKPDSQSRWASRLYLLAIAFGFAGSASAADLTISNWDGYMAKDVGDHFKAEAGLSVQTVKQATNGELMVKVIARQGAAYAAVFVSSPFAEILNKQGLLEPLDHKAIPNLANLYPEAANLAYDPGNVFSVPY